MRRLFLLIGLALLLTPGCKKLANKLNKEEPVQPAPPQPAPAYTAPSVHAPTGVVLDPGTVGGGGGGGAAQAVRKAATLAVTLVELQQLQLHIDTAHGDLMRMPTVEEI